MSAPIVTIAIPFYNEEARLEAAVRSVLRQTFTDFELLLLDDGSSDRSFEVARRFAEDPRVQAIRGGRRRHLAARLNETIALARGRYVARMDADDVAHPRRLERQLAALERDPSAAASGTWAALVDDDERAFGVVEASPQPASAARTLEHGVLPHPTLLARRDWFAQHRYAEDATRTEDRDLWCRAAAATRFAIVPEVLYVLRVETRAADFVATYRETQRQNRQLFLRYGPAMMGWPRTVRACASSFAKSAAFAVSRPLGLTERLVHRRGRPPTAHEERMIAEALAAGRA